MEQVHGLTLNQAVEKMRGPATEGLAWYKRSMLGLPFSRVHNPPIIELLRINHVSKRVHSHDSCSHRDRVVPIQFSKRNRTVTERSGNPSDFAARRFHRFLERG
jgi:hypothetical protein